MKFATCNCPVGAKYHALNCPTSPGREQNIPDWARPSWKPPQKREAQSQDTKRD